VLRGTNESRAAKHLHMRGKRMEEGVSERQKRGTRCACAANMGWGVCELRGVGQVFAHVGMKAHV